MGQKKKEKRKETSPSSNKSMFSAPYIYQRRGLQLKDHKKKGKKNKKKRLSQKKRQTRK